MAGMRGLSVACVVVIAATIIPTLTVARVLLQAPTSRLPMQSSNNPPLNINPLSNLSSSLVPVPPSKPPSKVPHPQDQLSKFLSSAQPSLSSVLQFKSIPTKAPSKSPLPHYTPKVTQSSIVQPNNSVHMRVPSAPPSKAPVEAPNPSLQFPQNPKPPQDDEKVEGPDNGMAISIQLNQSSGNSSEQNPALREIVPPNSQASNSANVAPTKPSHTLVDSSSTSESNNTTKGDNKLGAIASPSQQDNQSAVVKTDAVESLPSNNTPVDNTPSESKPVSQAGAPMSVSPAGKEPSGKNPIIDMDDKSVEKSSVTSTSKPTSTTRALVNNDNREPPPPPISPNGYGYGEDDDEEDEQLSSMAAGGGGGGGSFIGNPDPRPAPGQLDTNTLEVNLADGKVVQQIDNGGKFTDDEDSHFFAYFLTIMVTAIIFYLVFHNKQRIIALIIEGRAPHRSRRDSSRARYHKLDNNLEEAMSGTKGNKYDQIY